MPLPVIPNTYRVVLNWKCAALSGTNPVNVLHFRGNSLTSDAVFTALNDNVTKNMWLPVSNDTVVQTVDVTPLDGITATKTYYPTVPDHFTGSGIGSAMPQVAMVVKASTAKRGGSYRGRVFLPMIGENQQDHGVITPSTVLGVAGAWAVFLADMKTDLVIPVVASATLSLATDIVSYTAEGATATQRKRQKR